MAGHEDAMSPDLCVLLLACSRCYRQWLVLETGQAHVVCPYCRSVRCLMTTAWTAAACPWWALLAYGAKPVEPPGLFLRWLARMAVAEHPAGPIGSRCITPGMQLVQVSVHDDDCTSWEEGGSCTTGCHLTWTYRRYGGSDN